MNYIEVELSITPRIPFADIITSDLAEIGFESFVETEEGVKAYIPKENFNKEAVTNICSGYSDARIDFSVKVIPQQNWNEAWESGYEPIKVEDLCLIRAPFHPKDTQVKMEVVISPKMSFGTGHHETTWQMIKGMFEHDFAKKEVLDFGCGTGILSIVAEKLGAASVLGFDTDAWSVENAQENVQLNNCNKVVIKSGDSSVIPEHARYDVILANINRNVLMADMPQIATSLRSGGSALLSGFFEQDCKDLIEEAQKYGLAFLVEQSKNHWAQLTLQKS